MLPQTSDVGKVLNDKSQSLATRFRALFMLKNLGGDESVAEITRCLVDESDLLNHELAYCLGQMQNETAIATLHDILQNKKLAVITRHEAGEALGAIGSSSSLPLLIKYSDDESQEIAETCQLAVHRIKWRTENKHNDESSPFASVDPTPAALCKDIPQLQATLLDPTKTLFERYQAMFSLRNMNLDEAASVIAKGLKCTDSALFRHEIAFVLGQMQLAVVVPELIECLSDTTEDCMVRHECAEALGSIANEKCLGVLHKFKQDKSDIVRESCEVALDMFEYENGEEFHYAIDVNS